MKVSKVVLLAALMAGGSALVAAGPASAQPPAPAQAQPGAQSQSQTPAARQPIYSPAERAALTPLQNAYNAAIAARDAGQTPDWAAVDAALPAAQAAAQGNDARYLIARIQIGTANERNNTALFDQALEALSANPVTPPAELATFYSAKAVRAFEANDFARAEQALLRVQQITPNDPAVVNNLAIVRSRLGNTAGAIEALMQNIQAQEAANQRAGEDLYRRALSIAYNGRDRARSVDLAARIARHYPTPANWRDAVRIYRSAADPNAQLSLDAFRLARVAGGLEGTPDYLGFARILDQAALSAEVKAVVDEGIARGALQASDTEVRGMLQRANSRIVEDRRSFDAEIVQARNAANATLPRAVGDVLFGQGRYAEAAELYRVAAGKPGADTNHLNLRLGAALAMAGQRAEAETAFRAAGGEAADLAKLWLAWLSRRQG